MALTEEQKEYRRKLRQSKAGERSAIKEQKQNVRFQQKIQNATVRAKYDIKTIEKEFSGKTEAEKLRLTYTELVRRLAVESHRNFITEVDWDDDQSINLRKKQMDNLKAMLTVTKMMNDLILNLEQISQAKLAR